MTTQESVGIDDTLDRKSGIPAVSVIIRSYNRKEMLSRAIESVLNQTFTDFELIVADDGSTDGSPEYVRSLADKRVRLVASEKNQGGSATANLGFRNARGEWVANLDSDDVWYEDKLKHQMDLATQSGESVGVIYTGAELFDVESGKIGPGRPVSPDRDVFEALVSRKLGINFSTVLIRRKFLNEVDGFDESMPRGMDKDALIRLARICEFAAVDKCLARSYVNHGPHLSGNSSRTVVYREALLKKFLEWPEVSSAYVSQEYRSLAIHYARDGRYSLAFKRYLQGIRVAPLEIKGWVGLASLILTVLTFGRYTR